MRLHGVALQRYGGLSGLLSEVALESACAAARHVFEYECRKMRNRNGIARVAATYWFHITQAHAFVDGNKRLGLASFLHFLYKNGYDVTLSAKELEDLSLAIAGGKISRASLALKVASSLDALDL